MDLSPRLLVLGGGGYNPWSVGRLWTAVWGVLSGQDLPDRLPEGGQAVLRDLDWTGQRRVKVPPEPWITTLIDSARPGRPTPEVRERLAVLNERAKVWV